jgi:hypothetical protein
MGEPDGHNIRFFGGKVHDFAAGERRRSEE